MDMFSERESAAEGGLPPLNSTNYSRKDYGKTLIFVKMSKDANELAKIIRSAPTLEYVLMRGSMMNVSAMTQVFVDGKNLNTLEAEWNV
jgi:hypothetical protein